MGKLSDMNIRLFIPAIAAFLSLSTVTYSQTANRAFLTVAFYNVENLYDTIPSLFYDDTEWSATGTRKWDSVRYTQKLTNISRVIDELDADLIGLAEIESEAAVRDLVATLSGDYNYIHRTGSDRRGMDVALLFKGDKFVPDKVRLLHSGFSREFLYVTGELSEQRIDLIICHMPSQFNSKSSRLRAAETLYRLADSIHRSDPLSSILIAGDFNAAPSDKVLRKSFGTGKKRFRPDMFINSPFEELASRGAGTYVVNNRWVMLDNIFLDAAFYSGNGLRYSACGIFIRPYMLTESGDRRHGYPLRTFSGGRYTGGYSDHLPVFVRLEKK